MNRERYRTKSSMLMTLFVIETVLQLLPPGVLPEPSLAQTPSGTPSGAAATPADQTVTVAPIPSVGSPQASECRELARPLKPQERRYAIAAWNYFEANYQSHTGLVSDRQDIKRVTPWGIGDYIAALHAARSLDIISAKEFDQRTRLLLGALTKLPLYDKELLSRSYDPRTLQPIDYLDTLRPKGTEISSDFLPYLRTIRLSDDLSSLGMVPGLNPQGIDNFRGVTFPQSAGRVNIVDLFDAIIVNKFVRGLSPLRVFRPKLPHSRTSLGGSPVTGGTGWSALDVGRLMAALYNLKSCHPEYTTAVDEILLDWSYLRVVRDGRLWSAIVKNDEKGTETGTNFMLSLGYPEDRLGYEEYAARGFQLWGFDVDRSNVGGQYETTSVEGFKVPTRRMRPDVNPDFNNYTVSNPFLLYGLEFGFDPKMRELFEAIRLAQAERYRRTGKFTAGGTTVIDREPYVVHSTIIAGKEPWATVSDTGKPAPDARTVSTATAFATHALYPEDAYAQELWLAVIDLYDPSQGYYEGFYEKTGKPARAFSSSTNSMILQSLLYMVTQEQPVVRANMNINSPWWRAVAKGDVSHGLPITATPQARLIADASGTYWASNSDNSTVAQSPSAIKKPPIADAQDRAQEFTAPVASPPPLAQEFTAPVASPPPLRPSAQPSPQTIATSLQRPLLLKDTNRIAARLAWQYFERNWNPETGLVNWADNYPGTTLWECGSAILGIHAAHQLGLIGQEKFNRRIDRMLQTLETLPLPAAGLPNTAYNTRTVPTIRLDRTLDPQAKSRSPAVDAARFLLALHILRTYYPESTASRINSLVDRWNLPQLVKEGLIKDGSSGRQGYEQYAANILRLWNVDVTGLNIASVNVAQSNLKNLGSINDQTSDPYILWGLELGWPDSVKAQLLNVLKAQAQQSYFKYYSLSTNDPPWHATNKKLSADTPVRFLSTKSAFAWDSLLQDDPYATTLRQYVQSLTQENRGYLSGRYDNPQQGLKASIDVNTNAMILESLLYQARDSRPLAF